MLVYPAKQGIILDRLTKANNAHFTITINAQVLGMKIAV